MGATAFGRLLPKVISVCQASYILLLARGKLAQRAGSLLCEQLYLDITTFASYFGGLVATEAEKDALQQLASTVLHDVGDLLISGSSAKAKPGPEVTAAATKALDALRQRQLFVREILQGLARHCLPDLGRSNRKAVLASLYKGHRKPVVPHPRWYGSVA